MVDALKSLNPLNTFGLPFLITKVPVNKEFYNQAMFYLSLVF